MPTRASSLQNSTLTGLTREVASKYDEIKAIVNNIDSINEIANSTADISIVAANIVEILAVDTNADTAVASAQIATEQAALAQGYAASINPAQLVARDSATGAAVIPSGTTAQRPVTPDNGYLRYNTTIESMETYSAGEWGAVGGGDAEFPMIDDKVLVGETVVIPAGRTMVHPNLQVDGTLQVDGVLFIPSGGTYTEESINVASLDVTGTSYMKVAVGTTAQRPASPVNGQIRYNIDLGALEGYSNGSWGSLGGGATGGGQDRVFNLNGQVITTNYTIPVGMNATTAGDVTIASGVTVTISSGSKWSIV